MTDDRDPPGIKRLRDALESPSQERALRELFQEMAPPGVRILDRLEFERNRRAFYAVVRRAARHHESRGWDIRTNRLVLHKKSGHWGQIVFKAEAHRSPLIVHLFAGALSPYLMRVSNELDPARLPDLTFHVGLHWQTEFEFAEEDRGAPPPLDIKKRKEWEVIMWQTGVVLGPSTAEDWLRDVTDQVVGEIEGLTSDHAIRDWLLANEPDNDTSLRDAALLTQHLGLMEEVPAILERARLASERVDAHMLKQGLQPHHPDRSKLYRQFWSHKRFVRHLAEVRDAEETRTT